MSEFVEGLRGFLPEDWDIHGEEIGAERLLICLCGFAIELEGECPAWPYPTTLKEGLI